MFAWPGNFEFMQYSILSLARHCNILTHPIELFPGMKRCKEKPKIYKVSALTKTILFYACLRSPRPGWGRPGQTATTPAWTWWTPRSIPSPPPGRSSRPGRDMTRNRYKTNIKSQGFIWGEMSGLVGRSWCVVAVYLTRLWLGNNATTAADTRNTPGGRASGPSGRAQDFLVGELFVPS